MEIQNGLDLWVEEDHKGVYKTRFRVLETLFSGRSDFQKVDIVETAGHGRMLFNDGLAMISERDEFIYHDMIAHVPLFVHPNPKSVLVIGGGDGGTAREVIRHSGVHCDMVEIDAMVVEACKEHIPQTASELDNPRVNLMIDDGVKYVKETDKTYDVIIVDSTDPIGAAAPLFGPEFYQNVYSCLAEDGIVVAQGESPFFYVSEQESLLKSIGKAFPAVCIYNFTNLTYPGGLWSFAFASKGLSPLKDFNESRVSDSGLEFKYYNAGIHRAAFELPSFMKENLKGLIKA